MGTGWLLVVWHGSELFSTKSDWKCVLRSPPEEPVRVIPLFGLVEVQAVQPALLRFCGIDRLSEAVQQRRRAGDSQVGEQPIEQNTAATKGSLEIGLLAGLEAANELVKFQQAQRQIFNAASQFRATELERFTTRFGAQEAALRTKLVPGLLLGRVILMVIRLPLADAIETEQPLDGLQLPTLTKPGLEELLFWGAVHPAGT